MAKSSPHDQPADSLLAAARKLEGPLALQWAAIFAFYKALQREEVTGDERGAVRWLPLSSGRRIYSARPLHIANLLIGLAAAKDAEHAHYAVSWVSRCTPGGRGKSLTDPPEGAVPIAMAALLSSPEKAATVSNIEFQADLHRVELAFANGKRQRFADPAYDDSQPAPPIAFRGVLAGDVVRQIARDIIWWRPGDGRFVDIGPE